MAVSGKHRPLIPIPLPTRWISVWFLNVITSVPPTIAKALIQGLKHDLIADDRALRALIPQTLIPFDQAVRRTLRRRAVSKLQRLGLRRSGFRPLATGVRLLSEAGRLHRRHSGKPPALWQVVNQIGGEEGIFSAICCGKPAARWICWSATGWQRATAARLSANRRYGRQLEGNYRGGRKTAHPAIRYESARAGPIALPLTIKAIVVNWTSARGGTARYAGPDLLAADDPGAPVYFPRYGATHRPAGRTNLRQSRRISVILS